MALFSWLAKGRAVRAARGVPAGFGVKAAPPEARVAAEARPPVSEAVPVSSDRPDSAGPGFTGGAKAPATGSVGPRFSVAHGGAGVEPAQGAEAPVGLLPAPRAAIPDGGVIELPLARVLECVPLLFLAGDAERLVASDAVQKARVALPLGRVLGQLPSGRIEFSFEELRAQIPREFLSPEADAASRGEVQVSLDLAEVVSRVPASKMVRRGDQMEAIAGPDKGVADLIPMPFKPAAPGPVSETARLAKAVTARSIVGPQAPVPVELIRPPAKVPAPDAVIRAEEAPQPPPLMPVAPKKEAPKPLFGPLPTGAVRPVAKVFARSNPEAPPPPAAAKEAVSEVTKAAARAEGFRALPRARVGVTSSLVQAPARVAAAASPVVDEKTLAARALARWLGCPPGRPLLIREIPSILANVPGVAGAILSDSEALTVARELPPSLSEDAVSSSASVLFKRLRLAARELGGGFTNQTLVGLGQWTLLITYEPPFFLTTLHTSHQVGPRLDRRMRKIARALARLEAARPVIRA